MCWNGKWNKELKALYDTYYNMFGTEPDCDLENNRAIDFDSISFDEWKMRIRKSIMTRQPCS